jgi:predicted Zn finger-like uncharacterized protein
MSTYTYTDCNACGTRYQITRENLGRVLRCRKCGKEFETHEVVAAPPVPPPVPAEVVPPAPPAPQQKHEQPTFVVLPVMNNENVWNRNRGCADLLLLSIFIPPAIFVIAAVLNRLLSLLFPNNWP